VTAAREELIRQEYARWNAGEREIDPQVVHPDVVVHSAMTNATYHGYEGGRRWMAEIDDQFEDWHLSIEEFKEASDDRLLGIGTIHLRGRGGGVEFDQPVGWLFTFSGERLMSITTFPDRAQALAAAGLGPAMRQSE
jgi:ketosteroid isomerase-like protein